jgi:hypothetical protein
MNENQQGPGRRAFYKYMKPDTALAVLESRTVRFSTPLLFNDPFDVQSGLHFEFDLDSLHDKVLDRIEALASAVGEPAIDPENVWGQIVLEARKYYPTHGFPRERWKEGSTAPFNLMLKIIRQAQIQYQQHWQAILPEVRIFSVTEEKDNLLMWAHYAFDHTGAVFEFWSLPEEDNPLSVAQPVEYVKTPPPFLTESELIDSLTGLRGLSDGNDLYRRYAYIKSNHWSYEREWRVWYPGADRTQKFDTTPIRPNEFKAIYLGCCISPKIKDDILALIKKNFQGTRIFQARKALDSYGLNFIEI